MAGARGVGPDQLRRRSDEARADIEALVAGAPHAFLIPKVSGPEEIRAVAALLDEAERGTDTVSASILIAAVIERIAGLSKVEEIATADPRMTALVLGTEDMSVEYGYRLDRTGESLETLYLKSRCILAARLAGIDCIDAAHFYYRDLEGTRKAAEWAAQLGFSGKTCLSPVQVAPVNEAFAPTEEEIHWAHSVLEALAEAASNDLVGRGLAGDDGRRAARGSGSPDPRACGWAQGGVVAVSMPTRDRAVRLSVPR